MRVKRYGCPLPNSPANPMSTAYQVITFSPVMVESVFIRDGRMEPSSKRMVFLHSGADAPPNPFQALQLAENPVEVPVVLVLPTQQVGFRRVDFPFQDARQVQKALPFELESELISNLDQLHILHQLLSLPNGSSEALVYVLENTQLQQVVQQATQAGFFPLRVSFSAFALAAAHPNADALHFQVYLGLEEVFVSMLAQGCLVTARTFGAPLATMIQTAELDAFGTPEAALTRLGSESVPENLHKALEHLANEINHFLRTQQLAESGSVSVHGLLRHCLVWDAEAALIKVPPENDGLALGVRQRELLGLGHELGATENLLSDLAPGSFYNRRLGFGVHLREYKPALWLTAGLLMALLLVVGSNTFLTAGENNRKLGQINAELNELYNRLLPPGASRTNALSVLRERVDAQRKMRVGGDGLLVLDVLQQLTPLFKAQPGMRLESLVANASSITLTGKTTTETATLSLKQALESLAAFQGQQAQISHQTAPQGLTFTLSIPR